MPNFTTIWAPPIIPTRKHQRLDQRLRAVVYIAGSTALMSFCKGLGVTAFYISATGRRDHMRRIENRRELRHGAMLADPADRAATAQEMDLGWEHFLSPISEEMAAAVTFPEGIRHIDGVIEVDLAPADTTTSFEKRLAAALHLRQLNLWLGCEDGQSRMIEAGIDPRLRLHTAYRFIGPKPRLSLVTEAFLFRPRRELQSLIDTIDAVRAKPAKIS